MAAPQRPDAALSLSLSQSAQAEHLVGDVRGCERRRLSRAVVWRRDLDDVGARELDSAQRAEEGERLGRREAADLRSARAGGERRVEDVDVEGEEDGPTADAFADETRGAAGPVVPKLVAREDDEAELARGLEVVGAVDRAAQACLDGRLRLDQPLLVRPPEGRAVEEALAEVLVPRVAVGVELDECERTMAACEDAQLGERDGVIAAEREREDAALDERGESFLDLAVGALGVARRDGHVAVVDDRERLDDV